MVIISVNPMHCTPSQDVDCTSDLYDQDPWHEIRWQTHQWVTWATRQRVNIDCTSNLYDRDPWHEIRWQTHQWVTWATRRRVNILAMSIIRTCCSPHLHTSSFVSYLFPSTVSSTSLMHSAYHVLHTMTYCHQQTWIGVWTLPIA